MNRILKISVAIVIAGGIVGLGIKAIKNARKDDASLPVAKIYPIAVKEMTLQYQKTVLTLPTLAEVANDQDVVLSSRIAARVVNSKESGLHVNKGEVVAQLDKTDIRSNKIAVQEELNAAKTTLQNLQATHKRTAELMSVHGASVEEFQNEATAIAQTQAKIVSLKQQIIGLDNSLSYATITSPISGVVTKRQENEGALGMPGKPLLYVSAKSGFYLIVRVPSDVAVKGVVFHDKRYSATALNSTQNGLNEYRVNIDDTNVTSGDKLSAQIITFDDQGTFVPFDGILNRDAKSYVLILENGKVLPKEVHISQSAQQGVMLQENMAGTKIVIAKPDILLRLIGGYPLKIEE